MPNAVCEFALQDGVLEFKEPARKLLSMWVQGTVVNFIAEKEKQQIWKMTVASAIKSARDDSPWDPLDVYAVTLEFRFHADNHGNQKLDVENYVKPVVDAVAAGLFVDEQKDLSGIGTWDFPDSNFRTLLIHRAADPGDRHGEGVHVSVSVRECPQDRASVSERVSDEDRFATPRELEHCIKNDRAYGAMGSQAYHTDPACIWGTQIKWKNLRFGLGKDGKLCSHCRPAPSRSPT